MVVKDWWRERKRQGEREREKEKKRERERGRVRTPVEKHNCAKNTLASKLPICSDDQKK